MLARQMRYEVLNQVLEVDLSDTRATPKRPVMLGRVHAADASEEGAEIFRAFRAWQDAPPFFTA